MRLKLWQWAALIAPIAAIVAFLLIAAGRQIHEWGLNWIWAVFTLVFVGWRWLLVRWTRSTVAQVEAVVAELEADLEALPEMAIPASDLTGRQAEAALQKILQEARTDAPLWEDWPRFWQRCQSLVEAIAHVYYPQVRRPLLNIYVPQAYGLLRGTVDDLDQWMQRLSPVLNQVSIGQAYEAYEVYQKLEPSVRKVWQAWNWAQWLLNPAAAIARTATQRQSNQATQELVANLGQLLREAVLRNLGRQAIALYSGTAPPVLEAATTTPAQPRVQTQTLREILSQAETPEKIAQKPVNILLVGRTGAGKSSLINTLFVQNLAAVDVLPTTDRIRDYHWQTTTGESLTLWDSPGYEQAERTDLREQVLDHVRHADLLLLLNPAMDPALQMDLDFLKEAKKELADLPTLTIVTQVDRLRPIREWQPPYDWQWGNRPKETAIREAVQYRAEILGNLCDRVLPLVTTGANREAWGVELLSVALLEAIDPAKQVRLARFLKNLDARTIAAARVIDQYTFQMATTQGLAALLKSPILSFISTLTTGSPTLALLLAEKIPVEQLPVVIGKLQMAYELYNLLTADQLNPPNFDFLALWPLLLENPASPDRTAWAFGHALVEYWAKGLTIGQLKERFTAYLVEPMVNRS